MPLKLELMGVCHFCFAVILNRCSLATQQANADGRGRVATLMRGVMRKKWSLRKDKRVYAIKVEINNPEANIFDFPNQKTMYGGKKVVVGDTIYLFASENEGGPGLVAKGVIVSVTPIPKREDIQRQTPRVSILVRRTALATRGLGRQELKPHTNWQDGRPETELNFKFYRQATNKIVGISGATADFLETYF